MEEPPVVPKPTDNWELKYTKSLVLEVNLLDLTGIVILLGTVLIVAP